MRILSATPKTRRPEKHTPNKDRTHHRYEVQRRYGRKWETLRTYADASEACRYVECELVDSKAITATLRVVDSNNGSVVFER